MVQEIMPNPSKANNVGQQRRVPIVGAALALIISVFGIAFHMMQVDKAYPGGPELLGLAFVMVDMFLIVVLPFAVFGILSRIHNTNTVRIAFIVLLVFVSSVWWWVGQDTLDQKVKEDQKTASANDKYTQETAIAAAATSIDTCKTLTMKWAACIGKTFQQPSQLSACLAQAKKQKSDGSTLQTPRVKCYTKLAILQKSSAACDALTNKDEHDGCIDGFENPLPRQYR